MTIFSVHSWRRWLATAALVALLLLAAGCTRRVVISRWWGVFRPGPPAQAKTTARVPAPVSLPDDRVREAFALQARGAFNPATDDRRVSLLNARLHLDPQDSGARLELAAIYERYRLHEDALDQYARALNLAPSEAAAAGLARNARAAGRAAEVVPLLAAFLKISPEAADAWTELGILQDESGDHAAAERAFRRAAELRPTSERARNNLGFNLMLQNRLPEAESELRRALELSPALAAARNNLGTVLARRGDLDGARAHFLAGARLQGENEAAAHNNLAVALMEIGEYEQARDELVRALQMRHFFAPSIENFKLAQEWIRRRSELATAAGSLPLRPLPTALALALGSAGIIETKSDKSENKQ